MNEHPDFISTIRVAAETTLERFGFRRLINGVAPIVAKCEKLVITSNTEAEASHELLKAVKAQKREVTECLQAATGPLDAEATRIRGLFAVTLASLTAAEKTIKDSQTAYQLKLQRERQQKLIEAQREADRIAKEERERLAAIARTAKAKQDEIDRQIAEEQKKLEDAQTLQSVEDADPRLVFPGEPDPAIEIKIAELEKQREQVTSAGIEAGVAALEVRPEPVFVAPIVAPKLEGSYFRKDYSAEVTDWSAIPNEHLRATPKQQEATLAYLAQLAKTTKGALTIPGVKWTSKQTMVTKS